MHNQRRRENRVIRKNVAAWARLEGIAPSEVARLEKEPPNVAKQWAKDHGMSPRDFLDGVPSPRGAGGQQSPIEPPQVPPAAGPAPAVAPGHGAGGGHVTPGTAGAHGARMPGSGGRARQSGPTAAQWFTGTESWSTPELEAQVRHTLDSQGGQRDEAALLDGQCMSVEPVAGGSNETRKVVLDNGIVGYHKPFAHLDNGLASAFGHDDAQQPVNEVAAWRLAERMGPPWSEIVPPCVLRSVNGELGSFAVERPGRGMEATPWNVPEWKSAAFFDALVGQQDRHPGNYLVAGNRITLIDHGYTFGRAGDMENFSWLAGRRHRQDPALSAGEMEILERISRSPDTFGLRGMLPPDRLRALLDRVETMRRTGVMVAPTRRALKRQEVLEQRI